MIETYQGSTAFFIGNGINRTENGSGVSWVELLQRIGNRFGIDSDLTNDLKPLNLAFEEMLFGKHGDNSFQSKLKNLKTGIATILEDGGIRLIDNQVHKGLMNCGINEIITTNYDYNLELAIQPEFLINKIKYSINNTETKHSLYRGYSINGINVRHIHGELRHNKKTSNNEENYPEESIMIGFEHYSDYFKKIHDDIKGLKIKEGEFKNEKDGILFRITKGLTGKSWTDLFFTHKIVFAGFSLDFSEAHLWWLLVQREQMRKEMQIHQVDVNNEIIYCYANIETITTTNRTSVNTDEFYLTNLRSQKTKALKEILNALGVRFEPIVCLNYREFFLKVIEKHGIN